MSEATEEIQFNVGGIISRFSIIEMKIQEFITSHYVTDQDRAIKFYSQVLENAFFSFELKKRIFKRILKDEHPDIYKSFPLKELERAQELRNIAAHGSISASRTEDINSINKLCFRHGGKKYMANDLIKECLTMYNQILPNLLNLPGVTATYLKER